MKLTNCVQWTFWFGRWERIKKIKRNWMTPSCEVSYYAAVFCFLYCCFLYLLNNIMFNIWLLDIQHHSRNVYYGALFSLFLFTIHVDNCLVEIVTQKWHLFIFMHTHIQMKKWRYYNIRRQIYTNCTVVETPMSLWYANQTTS